MGRDHALICERCGGEYRGFNGPDECDCLTDPQPEQVGELDAEALDLVVSRREAEALVDLQQRFEEFVPQMERGGSYPIAQRLFSKLSTALESE